MAHGHESNEDLLEIFLESDINPDSLMEIYAACEQCMRVETAAQQIRALAPGVTSALSTTIVVYFKEINYLPYYMLSKQLPLTA